MSVGKKEKTFGFKSTDEDYSLFEEAFKHSGFPSKDEWMKSLVNREVLESVKEANHEFKQPLAELQVHTSRIYELVVNMVNQSVYLRDHAVKEVSDKLEQRESIIGEYQEKAKNALEESKTISEALKALEQEKNELAKQLDNQKATSENNQLLINEYKEKNDTLSGLVTKYQSFAEENEKLKTEHATERERLQSQVKEVMGQNTDQQEELKTLKRQIESLQSNHAIELERVVERKDVEREKALLEIEREHQQKLTETNKEYTNTLKGLYEQINEMRKSHEAQLEAMRKEPEKEIASNRKDNKQDKDGNKQIDLFE
jgi:FtsZ-binding cell division protein ZapB